VFHFPIFVSFAKDVKVRNGQLWRVCSIWSVISERGEGEWVGSVKESSEKAAKFAVWAYCNGDKGIVSIYFMILPMTAVILHFFLSPLLLARPLGF
jgi:uncharacterized protein (UPF0333 family)